MKKSISLLLAMMMLAGILAACGGSSSSAPAASTATGTSTADTATGDNDGEVYELTFNAVTAIWESYRPLNVITKWFCEELETRSEGRIKVTFYENGELYNTAAFLDAVQSGALEMGNSTSHAYGNVIPEAYATNIPMWSDGIENSRGYWRNDGIDDIFDAAYLGIGVRPLCHIFGGPYGFMVNKYIETVEELNGMLFRASSGLYNVWYQELGLNGIEISLPEVYDALQKGIVEGEVNSFLAADTLSLGEVLDYAIYPSFQDSIMMTTFMNEDVFQSLPSDLQELVLQVAEDAEIEAEKQMVEDYDKMRDVLVEFGMEIIDWPESEMDKLYETVQPMWDAYAEMGDGPAQIVEIMRNVSA